jgi:hypothetical protein
LNRKKERQKAIETLDHLYHAMEVWACRENLVGD